MRKLFLSSSFEEVERLFVPFVKEHYGNSDSMIGKKVEIVSTAALPEKTDIHIRKAVEIYEKIGMETDILELTEVSRNEAAERIRNTDFLHISGGNTFFLLQEIKRKELMELIVKRITEGMVYVGESAGTLITCPNIFYADDIDDRSEALELQDTKAMGILSFYPLPHYESRDFGEIIDKTLIKYDCKLKLVPFRDNEAITVDGEEMDIETLHSL